MITLEDALSLLSKYSEESTRVLAVFVTPSLSVARVIGTLQVVIENGTPPRLIVRKEDIEADQIKFRLADCQFEYGDFRDGGAEGSPARQFEGFLIVSSSKGDTLSLFEPKS